jgi:hypothetical protein
MSRKRALVTAVLTATAVVAIPSAANAQAPVACNEAALKTAVATTNTAGGGIINLTPGCTYTLTTPGTGDPNNGLPTITTPISIRGSNATITRATTAPDFRIFQIDPSGDVTLNNVTVSGGSQPTGLGGGILLNGGGKLVLNASAVIDNLAAVGGGVESISGTVVLQSSTVGNNNAGGFGAGLGAFGGSIAISKSTVRDNNASSLPGGGVFSSGAALTLNGSTVTRNTVTSSGGAGIYVENATATLNGTSVVQNAATGSGPLGAGIQNASTGTLNLNGSLVQENHARGGAQGGGIANDGAATLQGSLVINNTATVPPGGIYNTGTVSLIGSTVAGNIPTNCSPTVVPDCVN